MTELTSNVKSLNICSQSSHCPQHPQFTGSLIVWFNVWDSVGNISSAQPNTRSDFVGVFCTGGFIVSPLQLWFLQWRLQPESTFVLPPKMCFLFQHHKSRFFNSSETILHGGEPKHRNNAKVIQACLSSHSSSYSYSSLYLFIVLTSSAGDVSPDLVVIFDVVAVIMVVASKQKEYRGSWGWESGRPNHFIWTSCLCSSTSWHFGDSSNTVTPKSHKHDSSSDVLSKNRQKKDRTKQLRSKRVNARVQELWGLCVCVRSSTWPTQTLLPAMTYRQGRPLHGRAH